MSRATSTSPCSPWRVGARACLAGTSIRSARRRRSRCSGRAIAVPIHWGTYRRVGLSSEEDVLREPAESFARLAAELAPEVEVRILPVGGRLELTGVHEGVST